VRGKASTEQPVVRNPDTIPLDDESRK